MKSNSKPRPISFKLSTQSAKKAHAVEGMVLRNVEAGRFLQIKSSSSSHEVAAKKMIAEFGNSAKNR